MKRRFASILLGALTCLMLIAAGTGEVCASFFVTNTAGLNYMTGRGRIMPTATDTAAMRIIMGPQIQIAKDVRNVRSNETSTDMVNALHGDMVEFVLTVTNSGDDYAKNVVIMDTVPAGTVYETGSAVDTTSFDTMNPPDTITFQHIAGGPFDEYDTTTVTAIKWIWDSIEDVEQSNNTRAVKFRVRVE